MAVTVRFPSIRPTRKALKWISDGRKQPRGQPKNTRRSTIKNDL